MFSSGLRFVRALSLLLPLLLMGNFAACVLSCSGEAEQEHVASAFDAPASADSCESDCSEACPVSGDTAFVPAGRFGLAQELDAPLSPSAATPASANHTFLNLGHYNNGATGPPRPPSERLYTLRI